MNEGRGFQFTPFGMTDLGDTRGGQGLDLNAAAPPKPDETPRARVVDQVDHALRSVELRFTRRPKTVGLKPRDVVRNAKARAKEIRAELRRVAKLEKELSQLDRLIAAAEGKTIAPVRAIETARKSVG